MGKFYEAVGDDLALFVRQSAWLNAVPEIQGKTLKAPAQSRRDRYKQDGIEPQMPPLDAGAHLLEYLWEIGPTIPTGMGEVPISQAEIRAWQDNMGIELQPWQVQLLRRLSMEYLSQALKAKEPACKPPFGQLYRSPNLSKKIDDALD